MQVKDKYSIDRETFNAKWLKIRNTIFYPSIDCRKILTQPIFKERFHFSFINTGYHFYREDFESFNHILSDLGEKEYVICNACNIEDDPRIFEYEVGSSFDIYSPRLVYDEEGFMNTVLRYPFNHLIFGKRGDWGLFCSEPYDIIIVGFAQEIQSHFLKCFPDRIDNALCWLQNYEDKTLIEKVNKLYN